jgi:predicted 3-demethylubiquinone-9 3-methyltransferase (glyoxalase superfamily)
MRSLAPFLMFCGEQHGKAEEAVMWYCSVFDSSRVVAIDRYDAGDNEPAGTVRLAVVELGGHTVMAIDSAAPHSFTFTPAISIWIDCSTDDEIKRLSASLGDGGQALMPLDNYGFSRQFTWIQDRYGVTWQLNLPD